MKKKNKLIKEKFFLKMPFDIDLILVIAFLNIIGIIMIYSASYYYAETTYGYAPDYFMTNQIIFVLIGFAVMIAIGFFRPSVFRKFWLILLLAAFALVVAVRIPGLGKASHGAYRWIVIKGHSLQVAEPIKICMIIFLAEAMTRMDVGKLRAVLIIFGIVGANAALVLFLSSNMSSAIIIAGIAYIAIMINRPDMRGMLLILAIGFLVAAASVLIIVKFIPYSETENFRITRVRAWYNPQDERFIDDQAYQARQAFYAIASGGFFGRGLGQSLIKFRMPEPHNDYILAIIFEELGVFGVLIITFLYVYLLYKIFTVYRNCRQRFPRLMVLGVFLHIALQVVMNYMVTLGLFPTMGVTLPFISSGGSAAAFTLAELGLVLSVDRQNKEIDYYKEAEREMTHEDPSSLQIIRQSAKRQRRRSRT